MPDITLCKGENCTIKNECYRFTATPDKYRQSYFVESPCTKKMGGTACDYYLPARNSENVPNQCDGCIAGIYKDVQGMHRDEHSKPLMVCQASKYSTETK